MKTEKQMAAAAADFAKRWAGRGYEKGDSQIFWAELLTNVYGVEDISDFIRYEEQVKVDKTNFIDGHIRSTRVLIEQKSLGKDLRAPVTQSDGSRLNPFQQAKRYVANMPLSEHPRWIVTCNFAEFLIYDMEQPNGEPESILLADLGREYYRLTFLVDAKNEHLTKEMEVSMQAGEIVGRIYDALLAQYDDNSPEALRWLNILCVRIVFCLYAEDAGIFRHDQFHDYLSSYEPKNLRRALQDLFEILNMPLDQRSKYLQDDLKAFPYTNGGLFEEKIEIPQFTEELKQTLLQNASLDFDWSEISPTIFGAVFESTLNPETRRSGGMHYTSIENIHKVIDPLFLNDLRRELDDILEEKVERTRVRKLEAYQDRLARLTFLDPACGSGNFLTETYLSLRRLENEALRQRYHGQVLMGEFLNPIKVSIHQFYGIEINDFAVTVATTALWISEAQMLAETERIVQHDIDFLPLKSYANIREGNALRVPWDEWEVKEKNPTIVAHRTTIYPIEEEKIDMVSEPVIQYGDINLYSEEYEFRTKPKAPETRHVTFDYIMGNPPFVGGKLMSASQKKDMLSIFGKKWKNLGNMDYVCCWYKKAVDIMKGTDIEAALVSTNSITQGQAVASLLGLLIEDGIYINFAHRTFRWDSEATLKAHVHCVVIGFSYKERNHKYLYTANNPVSVNNINGFLVDSENIIIDNRTKPISDVPIMDFGNMPNDGGNLLLTTEERDLVLQKEPNLAPYIRPFLGAVEFINRKIRYCFWLKGVSPDIIHNSKILRERVENVRQLRLASTAAPTREKADIPHLFFYISHPDSSYLLVPSTSSERRRYIPMGYMDSNTITSNAALIVANASLYHFGVMESNVHMAWVRAVGGRLKSDYRYSNKLIYNNFPWPLPTDEQREKIEQTAQSILDARALYPDSSLAALYDEATMPLELRRAHQANDRAVMQAYGFNVKTMTESQCVAELFKLYQELTK